MVMAWLLSGERNREVAPDPRHFGVGMCGRGPRLRVELRGGQHLSCGVASVWSVLLASASVLCASAAPAKAVGNISWKTFTVR